MRAQIAAQLLRQTGHDVEWWNAAVAEQAVTEATGWLSRAYQANL